MEGAEKGNPEGFQAALGDVYRTVVQGICSSALGNDEHPPVRNYHRHRHRPRRCASVPHSPPRLFCARNQVWGYIRSGPEREHAGRFAVDESGWPGPAPRALADGSTSVELNFQTMQILVNSCVIQALDSHMASDRLVRHVLQTKQDGGEDRVFQCANISSHQNREMR